MVSCKGDNILVKNLPAEIGKGIIYIPPEFRRSAQYLQRGKVISAGEGTGLLPMPVKPGDVMVYDKNAGFDITINGEDYRVLKNYNIICAK